jgi:hypothetical protein
MITRITTGKILVLPTLALALATGGCSQPTTGIEPVKPEHASEAPADYSPSAIARRLVTARTGIDAEDIEILSSEVRQFRDSSMGCPVADRSYLQVITQGHQVLVQADSQIFDLRITGRNGRICDRPRQKYRGN